MSSKHQANSEDAADLVERVLRFKYMNTYLNLIELEIAMRRTLRTVQDVQVRKGLNAFTPVTVGEVNGLAIAARLQVLRLRKTLRRLRELETKSKELPK